MIIELKNTKPFKKNNYLLNDENEYHLIEQPFYVYMFLMYHSLMLIFMLLLIGAPLTLNSLDFVICYVACFQWLLLIEITKQDLGFLKLEKK